MSDEKIAHRPFQSYDEYVYQQGGKARGNKDKLLEHMPRHVKGFTETFCRASAYLKHGPVLCLGARTGAESLGATAAGYEGSVGIDLHPVGPTVLQGDWHDIQFPEKSFANAYSNSLDHCLYLDKLAEGVKRVLQDGGRFYVMATNREGNTLEEWQAKWSKSNEALFWKTSDDLAEAICGYGFDVVKSWRDGKWGHYVLKVRA
jgi:SAM-dependent methyltransferase